MPFLQTYYKLFHGICKPFTEIWPTHNLVFFSSNPPMVVLSAWTSHRPPSNKFSWRLIHIHILAVTCAPKDRGGLWNSRGCKSDLPPRRRRTRHSTQVRGPPRTFSLPTSQDRQYFGSEQISATQPSQLGGCFEWPYSILLTTAMELVENSRQ